MGGEMGGRGGEASRGGDCVKARLAATLLGCALMEMATGARSVLLAGEGVGLGGREATPVDLIESTFVLDEAIGRGGGV